jgi:HEAT repeat protein
VVKAMGRRADGELRERLLAMSRDPSLVVRERLADSIADRDTELAVVLAQRLADDPEPEIRARSLRALAMVDDPSALARFAEMAKSSPSDVQAILQKTSADHPAVTAVANALAERRNPDERLAALAAIHHLGALTQERLEAAFADPSAEVRLSAIELSAETKLDLGEAHERLLRDPDQRVRDAVRRTRFEVI